ncbi:MAG TPA: hypothetical protein PL033_09510 [Candidatus Brocadiia bacterium]|nr:hypothetical protein [Candidatus Brocadiia bacterium]
MFSYFSRGGLKKRLPAAIAGEDMAGPCREEGVVARMIAAAKG